MWRKENPLELLSKDISNFDAQSPAIGSLLTDIDVAKKNASSNFLKKAPNNNDVVLKHRLDRLNKKDEPYNKGDDDDDDDGGKTYESFNWIRKFYILINWTGPYKPKSLGRGGLEEYRRRLSSAEETQAENLFIQHSSTGESLI